MANGRRWRRHGHVHMCIGDERLTVVQYAHVGVVQCAYADAYQVTLKLRVIVDHQLHIILRRYVRFGLNTGELRHGLLDRVEDRGHAKHIPVTCGVACDEWRAERWEPRDSQHA